MKVFFDLETNGYVGDDNIFQRAALCGYKTFSVYALPISP